MATTMPAHPLLGAAEGGAETAERLAAIGVQETEPNIRNKIARGGFTAVFPLQVMAVTGAKELRLD